MKKRYVAKISDNLGKLHDYELSPRFDTIQDCLKYINTNRGVIKIEIFLYQAFSTLLVGNHFENGKAMYSFCFGGSFIRVYDLEQGRFIAGFDL